MEEATMKFTTNVGSVDRIIRIVLGLALIALAVTGVFSPWGYIGVILVVTAFLKFCPAYAIVGMKTSE
jgi:hypothetical protein